MITQTPFQKSLTTLFHKDANEGFYFEDQLTRTLPDLYKTIYAKGNAVKLVDYKSNVNPFGPGGFTTAMYYKLKPTGLANWTFSEVGDDLINVDVIMDRERYSVHKFGAAITFTDQNILEAQGQVFSVIEQKREGALELMAQTSNQFAFFGRVPKDKGKQTHPDVWGLTNHPEFAVADVSGADANARKWNNKTGDQIVQDLFDAINKMKDLTNGNFNVDTIALPMTQLALLKQKRIGTNTDSAIDYFQKNYGNITLIEANELKGAGAGNTDIFIAYERNAKHMWFEHSEIQMTEIVKPQPGVYKMNMLAYSGGIIPPRPASVLIYKGI
jgi:hypothetical protein